MEVVPKQKSLSDFFKITPAAKPINKAVEKQENKQTIVYNDPPVLTLVKEFISEAEEKYLWQEIHKLPWKEEYKRKYQVHGYGYDPITKSEMMYLGRLPSCFDFLIQRIMEKKLMLDWPDQSVVNSYEPGIGIGAHIDNGMFGDQIVNVSLGSDIVMDFYGPQEQKKSILLPKRSLLLVENDARHLWKHGIAHRKTDKLDNGILLKRDKRVSITLRVASKHPVVYKTIANTSSLTDKDQSLITDLEDKTAQIKMN